MCSGLARLPSCAPIWLGCIPEATPSCCYHQRRPRLSSTLRAPARCCPAAHVPARAGNGQSKMTDREPSHRSQIEALSSSRLPETRRARRAHAASGTDQAFARDASLDGPPDADRLMPVRYLADGAPGNSWSPARWLFDRPFPQPASPNRASNGLCPARSGSRRGPGSRRPRARLPFGRELTPLSDVHRC
jgi:hypothetical protein